MAEEVYRRLNELREQVQELRETVDDTHDRVEQLETVVEQQTAVIEALAEREGIDVERVHAEAAIEEAEDDQSPPETGETSGPTEDEPTPKTD